MVYTLSTPTAVALDAACHPYAGQLLEVLRGAFTLTDRGRATLTDLAGRRDVAADDLAWGMVELLDGAAPSTVRLFATASRTRRLPAAADLARSRLGDARAVARLVATETGPWPTGPTAPLASLGERAGGAVAAAAAAAAWWSAPELPAEHVETLTAPWRAMLAADPGALDPVEVWSDRASAVSDALTALAHPDVTLDGLAGVRWPSGMWERTMHAAAWAAFEHGRLHAQLVAVLAATEQVVHAHPDADPVALRSALTTAHTLVIAALVADVLEPDPLATLLLADAGL